MFLQLSAVAEMKLIEHRPELVRDQQKLDKQIDWRDKHRLSVCNVVYTDEAFQQHGLGAMAGIEDQTSSETGPTLWIL